MAAQLPTEVTQHINAYMPRDKNNMSPTSPLINDFIKTVNDPVSYTHLTLPTKA